MEPKWNDHQPIYRQLYERIVEMILEGTLAEGEAVPSVRNVAAEYRLNPITVSKAYQALADEGLVDKQRGLGMFVRAGAREQLMAQERQRFLTEEWPQVMAKARRLGLSTKDLLQALPDDEPNE